MNNYTTISFLKFMLLSILSFGVFTAQSQDQQFVIDRTFGDACGSSQIFFQANQYELFKLSEGKYMIIGDKFGSNGPESNQILFARYHSDGKPDTSFAPNGIKMFNFRNYTKVRSATHVNGKIYIVGHQADGNGYSSFRASVSRFHEDGSPDSTFNETGNLIEQVFSNPISCSFYTHVVVQPDGKIVCFGYESSNINGGSNNAVGKRYHIDGSVDLTFNSNPGYTYSGFLLGNSDYFSPGILESDGSMRFVFPAYSSYVRVVSVKIDSSGNAVTSYGTNGINVTDVEVDQNKVHRFAKSGNLIYGLHAKQNLENDMRLYSIDENGDLNVNFSADGVLDLPNFPGTSGSEQPYALHIDSQNKIYSFGSASFSQDKCAFYRTNLTGDLDTTLAGTGSSSLQEFSFSGFRSVYFENDSTIIASIFTNSRMGLTKIQLKSSNISILASEGNVICEGSSTQISVFNPNDCYSYSWTKDGESFGSSDSVIEVNQSGIYQATAISNGETSFSQELIITVEDCTGLNEINNSTISVYPNPTTSFLNFSIPNIQSTNYQIFDISGRIVLSSSIHNQEAIDVSGLLSGLYLIQLKSDGFNRQMRFVKN
jgi:uncharacterized delta-60 repeat protein